MPEVEELLMLIAVLSRFVGLASELMKLSERALAGEKVTKEELEAAKAKMSGAVAGWDAACAPGAAKPAAEPLSAADG